MQQMEQTQKRGRRVAQKNQSIVEDKVIDVVATGDKSNATLTEKEVVLKRMEWRLLMNVLESSDTTKKYTAFDLIMIEALHQKIHKIEDSSTEESVRITLTPVEFQLLGFMFHNYSSFLNTPQIRILILNISGALDAEQPKLTT
jgi:pyruvate/2-oxoglutarate dehydrogenase complex dihydrolipoamide acyltransferase (E2) component